MKRNWTIKTVGTTIVFIRFVCMLFFLISVFTTSTMSRQPAMASSSATSSEVYLTVDGSIHIVEVMVIDSDKNPVEQVKVTLYSDPAVRYTNKEGIVTFEGVLSGDHRVVVEHNEVVMEKEVEVGGSDETVRFVIEITEPDSGLPVVTGIVTGAKKAIALVGKFLEENKNDIEDLMWIPTATGVISMGAMLGMTLLEIPSLILEFVLWLTHLTGMRARGKPWGVVYDAVSKSPVTRAVVRLFREGQLIDTMVTDVNGVFCFVQKEGKYAFRVSRSGYNFPSRMVVGKTDGHRSNIYHGEEYEVTKDKEVIHINVPIDPKETSELMITIRRVGSRIMAIVLLLNPVMLTLGLVLAVILYMMFGRWIQIVFAVLNLTLLVWHIYLRSRGKGKWGKAMDVDGQILSGVELGLYDRKYGRLVDTRVTDDVGRFQFVVPGDEYLIRPADTGYVIDDPGKEKGYLVGKKCSGTLMITERIILRRIG